jgi:hypothetical protein
MERTAALRLDAEWAKVRSGRAGASPRERERMLKDLIAALSPHAEDDLPLTARLSLRYGDLARHHFDTGQREDALSAVDEAIWRCEEPARHDEEHARWYARALINQAVYLAEPLSDELGLPRYALNPHGDQPSPDAREEGLAATLEHLGDQLERRLRRCPFDGGLTRLRERDLLPARLLPLAVLAARIEGVEPDVIAEGLRLDVMEVRQILRAHSWRAVWRFDIQEADGSWTPMAYPWRGMDAIADLSAEAVAAELADAFVHSPDRPPPSVHWRIAVWWEEEDHLDGSRFRRTYAPSRPGPPEHPSRGRTPS